MNTCPPCQTFSPANREENGGKNGKQNSDCVYKLVDAVRILDPYTVSFENVTGILNKKHIHYLQKIVRELVFKLEYNVRVFVLNAANYGDAQKRERVFLIASKAGMVLPEKPQETHGPGKNQKPYKTVEDCIGDLADIPPVPGEGRIEVNGEPVTNHSIIDGADSKQEPIILRPDGQAPTLYGQSTFAMRHYSHDRNLTVRELARLQSFPDTHKFPTIRSVARRQIQNAGKLVRKFIA